MDTPVEQRFVTRPDVIAARQTLDTSMAHFSHDIAQLSPAYDGALFAVPDPHYPNDLGPISHALPERVRRDQARFSKQNLFNRRIQLAGTALQQSLEDRSPLFTQSAMQPERHMTWGAGLSKTGRAAIQVAFNVHQGTLPSNDEMDELWARHAPLITEAFQPLQHIQDETENFLGKLELDPATQPNAFAIRWDVIGSTEMAFTKLGPFQAYLDHWKREVHRVMAESQHTVYDLGDGENLILPLERTNPFDTITLRRMRDTVVLPLAQTLVSRHEEVARQYLGTLNPEVRFAVSMGNVYPSDTNKETGLLLYEAARSMKRPDGILTISPSARFD